MIVLWAVGALLVALLLRAPGWVLALLMTVALVLSVGVLWLGDLQRALAPLLLSLLALGLLVPATVQSARSARVAPPRRRPKGAGGEA